MIISPPLLLVRNPDETDAAYVARCMTDTAVCVPRTNAPEGSFPVSFNLGWHGGLHLQAPSDGQSVLPVRAVADGEVVFARRPTPRNANPSPGEPRNYNPYSDAPAWTDDGCIILRHTTQIGADAQGQAVEVTFFSIYEHLSALRGPALQAAGGAQNALVYRKEVIGTAGQVYGRENQLHFEIVCDDANLQRLIGRQTGDLNTGADGRSDVVFGELYFRLPAETAVYASAPLDNNPVAYHRPRGTPANQPAVPLAAAYTTTDTLIVGLRYAAGEGAAGERGQAYLSTYAEDGTPVGAALPEPDAEYNLYTRATAISKAYPETGRPAPSAVYELLRFGRVIDTTHETLTPDDVPHWRKIAYPGGTGWVNLNAPGVRKFSDADFPHWKGWKLIDDDTDADSRCESAMLARMIEDPDNADSQLTHDELLRRLPLDTVRARLKRTLCKFPTELNQATIQDRWGWLVGDPEFNLSQADFDEFAAHVRALTASWNDGWLPNAHWHFQPREFITAWRQCGWLSQHEMMQLIPRAGVRDCAGSWDVTERRINRLGAINLNNVFRKYGVTTAQRQIAFLAQVYIETGCLSLLEEAGRAQQQRRRDGTFYWPQPMMEYYGAFYGRGIMQLTWAGTYADYGKFRALPDHHGAYVDNRITANSVHDWAQPTQDAQRHLVRDQRRWAPRFDPDIVASDLYNACDSGAFFWVQKHFMGVRNIHRLADESVDSAHIGRMSILVNGGGNGYEERLQYASFIERYRGDGTDTAGTARLTATRQGITHGQWTAGSAINLTINYTPQRPA